MIGFGELHRLALQWQMDIAAVERAYVSDWIVKGIFDHPALARVLVLRGGAALRYAHCADYPIVQDPEFLALQPDASSRGGILSTFDFVDARDDASPMDASPTRGVADIPQTP